MLTLDEAKEILAYEASTGLFFWRKKISRKVVVGKTAGCVGGHGYFEIRIHGVKHKGHRLAWLLTHDVWPPNEVDHINGDRSDNRLCNLRLATSCENKQNASRRSDNSSGHPGVSWYKKTGSWRADIQLNGKQKYLGSFHVLEDAISAYQAAKSEFHTFNPVSR